MCKRIKMTLDEHHQMADKLALLYHQIYDIHDDLKKHYGKTSKVRKAYDKLLPLRPNGIFSMVFGELENDFNDVITDEEYEGNIYSNFEERYEKLQSAI